MRYSKTRILFCLFFCTSSILYAQGVTTGSISGIVVDRRSSEALMGATIVAEHLPTGTRYGTATQRNGRFMLRGVRVGGPYRIRVSYVGYAPDTLSGVYVELGQETTVSIALSPLEMQKKEIVVTGIGDRTFTSSKTGSGSTVSSEEIASLPSINRSLSDIARVNPYATQTTAFGADDGLQGISILGSNSRFNNIQIDGAIANDIFGLGQAGTAGSQANANLLSLDAIEELQVNISPYDIRQSGFTGGLINAVTRSGTNTFKGSAFFFGRNQYLVGLSPDVLRQPYAQFSDAQFGARLGGPILRDKIFFHVTTETRLRNRPLEIALNNPAALNNFPHSKAELDEIIQIMRQVYSYDAGNADLFISRNNTFNIIARFDWNISDRHKLQFRHNYTNAFQDRNVLRTTQVFSLSSQWNEFRSINNSSVLQWNSIWGDNITNEFRIAWTQTNDERVLRSAPFPQVKVMLGADQVLLGPERNSHANALDQTQLALTNDLSIFLGEHTITIGTHNELYRFNNLYIPDYFGTYTFRDIQALRDRTPSFYQVSYANLSVTGGDPTPRARWGMMQSGLYIMDEWSITRNLRLTAGIRADIPIYFDRPYENSMFAQRFDSLARRYAALPDSLKRYNQEIPSGLRTSRLPDARPLWAPRIGFNYDVSGDRTFQVRGGTGIFSGRVPAVWLSNQYSNTGVDLYRVSIGRDNDPNAPILMRLDSPSVPLRVTLDPYNPPKPGDPTFPGQPITTTQINIIDPNFRFPQVWRSTLGADIQFTPWLRMTAEVMYGQMLNTVEFRNINLRRSQVMPFSPLDGRPLYARSPAGRTDSNAAPEFTQVILLSSRSEGYQYSGMLSLTLLEQNPILRGLSGTVSYVYSATYDLADATAATALSNWQNTDATDPNRAQLGRSNFDVPHRITATLFYRVKVIGNLSTTFGLFYTGNSGRPYSFTYIGDYNGDNITHNDLIYVPRPEDKNTRIVVVPPGGLDLRTADQIWQQLMDFIEANSVLRRYRGQVLPRNSMREPWIHQLDLRIVQQLPSLEGTRLELTVDVQNLLNLLNSSWGLQQYVNFQSYRLITLVNDPTTGTPFDTQGRLRITYSSPTTSNGKPGIYETDSFFSRWRMQVGLRVTF
ncbi:MAG: carboxypeptidase regulatory-like domain-containing protein [Bacteroidota bacterium]|nr:carboxypeptidase regulatory-like domain-containing protein [Bacteroidota bacterium]